MRNYILSHIIGIVLLMPIQLSAQNFCRTIPSSNAVTIVPTVTAANRGLCRTINTQVHIVRNTNSTGGRSLTDAQEGMRLLNEFFQERYGITFTFSYKYLDNSQLLNNYSTTENFIFSGQYNTPNSLNIYILPNDQDAGGGIAGDIGSNMCIIYRTFNEYDALLSNIVAHEVGHCLGLYHTHETFFCRETTNGSNCNRCGDFVCDTPADPYLGFNVNPITCTWNAPQPGYNPDTRNAMSYSSVPCLQRLTDGQLSRIDEVIASNPLVASYIINNSEAPLWLALGWVLNL